MQTVDKTGNNTIHSFLIGQDSCGTSKRERTVNDMTISHMNK